jgi:hypothetical protein
MTRSRLARIERFYGALGRVFALFETPRNPRLFALFRMAFFGGLALHFAPSLLFLEENYGPGVVRAQRWNPWLFEHLHDVPPWLLRLAAVSTLAALVMGFTGLRPRLASCVSLLGLYTFTSFNALAVQTLALGCAWGVLPLFCVCRGASAALSVDAAYRQRKGAPALPAPSVLANLVLWHVLLTFFAAGVEKLLWGWPLNNEMAMLFSTPRGWILRDWAWSLSLCRREEVTLLLSWVTVATELLVPLLLLIRRTRLVALVIYESMFLGIIAMIEVPPLFFTTFAAGALLILDERDLRGFLAHLRWPWRARH